MKSHLDREVSIENAITGAPYLVQPMWRLKASREKLLGITAICNEDLVYRWCFRGFCEGKPYPEKMAADWFRYGTEGWENGTHFVYLVTDSEGDIAAACDIKSATLEKAEVGYWSSVNHRGVMTNTTRAIVQLADEAGFEVLFADIHPENQRSLAVIQRCGFQQTDRQPTIEGHTPFDRINPIGKS
ncbi:MAG: GNAT family N-acetyltransferase [Verrucomicrobiota bacterium]